MAKISNKKCPVCHAIANTDIFLSEFMITREYGISNDKDNAKKYERYEPPDNLVTSTDNYVIIYQCPCCKTIYDEHTNADEKTWEVRCQEVVEGYDWWDNNG